MSRYVLLLAFSLALAASTRGQFVEQIDVAVVNVDVVVTGPDGKPVRGLTRDDFTIYENGKAQTITNFSAFDTAPAAPTVVDATPGTAAAPAPVPHRPRLIVLFIDIDEMEPVPRQRFFEAMKRYVDTAMRPGDFLTLLTWADRVRVILPATMDRKVVSDAMQILAESSRWSKNDIMRRTAATIINEARSDAAFAASLGQSGPSVQAEEAFREWVTGEERCAYLKRKFRELRNLLVSLARADLQKILVFASDDAARRPTRDCSTAHELDALVNAANAYGLTIHAFHPPGARDRIAGNTELREVGSTSAMAAEYHRVFDQSDGLLHLAYRTGGRVGVGPAESAEILERAATELETYYSLGYRLQPGNEDKPRKLKVLMKDKNLRVRTRDTVVRLSETAKLRDRVTTSLYLPDPATSASLTFTPRIAAMRREGRSMFADVVLTIPAENLLLLPSGQKLRGSFSVLVAAGRELGDASDVTELRQDFDSAKRPTPGAAITYSFSVKMRPDSRRLAIALRDNLSGDVATKLVMLEK